MKDLESIKEYFGRDRYATEQTGVEIIDAEAGYARCMLKIDGRHKNATGHVMGGVYFTLADYTFAVASNLDRKATITQTAQISFLASPKDDLLYAQARKIRAGKRSCFYTVSISDGEGNEVAYVTVTGYILDT